MSKSCLYESKPFLYVSKTFIYEIFFINSASLCYYESQSKVLINYFGTFSIKRNVTVFTKVFCSFVAATTRLLIAITNPVTIVIISYARATLTDFLGAKKLLQC